MRSKSEIKTTKHIACAQKNCLSAYAHIKKILSFLSKYGGTLQSLFASHAPLVHAGEFMFMQGGGTIFKKNRVFKSKLTI